MQEDRTTYKLYKSTLNVEKQKKLQYLETTHYGIYVMSFVIRSWTSVDEIAKIVDQWFLKITDIPVPVGYEGYEGTICYPVMNNSNGIIGFHRLVMGENFACTDIYFHHTTHVKRWCLVLDIANHKVDKYAGRFAYHKGEQIFIYPLPALTGKQVVTLREIRDCVDIVLYGFTVQCVV